MKTFIKTNKDDFIVIITNDIGICDVQQFIVVENLTLNKPLVDEKGRYNYKYINKKLVELTEEEKEELFPTPAPQPSQLDVIEAQIMYTALMTDTLLEV